MEEMFVPLSRSLCVSQAFCNFFLKEKKRKESNDGSSDGLGRRPCPSNAQEGEPSLNYDGKDMFPYLERKLTYL